MKYTFLILYLVLMSSAVSSCTTQPSVESIQALNKVSHQTSELPDVSDNPIELGQVNWLRNYDDALKASKASGKPIFILFQEVPGCATCTRYGSKVLSHPLIVEAIESHFTPLAIHNNKGGHDRKILEKFGEPSWNNPVVRIIDANESELSPRLSGNYSPSGVSNRMIVALTNANLAVPTYLKLVHQESDGIESGTATATFSMFCFWTGEKVYGQLDGVLSTKAGFMHGNEVVEVTYNPSIISFEELTTIGKNQSCASRLFSNDQIKLDEAENLLGEGNTKKEGNFRLDRAPKYYLSRTIAQYIPMTPIQSARVNAAIGSNEDFRQFLSPRQLTMLEHISNHPKANWTNWIEHDDLQESWNNTTKFIQELI